MSKDAHLLGIWDGKTVHPLPPPKCFIPLLPMATSSHRSKRTLIKSDFYFASLSFFSRAAIHLATRQQRQGNQIPSPDTKYMYSNDLIYVEISKACLSDKIVLNSPWRTFVLFNSDASFSADDILPSNNLAPLRFAWIKIKHAQKKNRKSFLTSQSHGGGS